MIEGLFGGASLEAVLMWALKKANYTEQRPNQLPFVSLINAARDKELIQRSTAQLAHSARVVRNLIHAGVADRRGAFCTKATALTALAGLHSVIDDLKVKFP
jgi:hypothetical protein